jgi:predicted MFS family arabinose efflux permease
VGGAFLTWYLLYTTDSDYHLIFWIAIIPSAIGLFILMFFVKDKESNDDPKPHKPKRHRIHWSDIARLGRSFWMVMGVVMIFTLSHCSESFISLRAENLGLAEKHLPAVMFVMNAVVVLTAYYSGALSDRVGRKIFLVVGFSAQILALLVLGFANQWEWVILGVALWGIQMGTTQSILVTIVVDTTPKDLHGTAFGVFFLISGTSLFFASHITGHLWHHYSPLYAFGSCAMIGGVALGLLTFLKLPKIEVEN